jgi:hypothetical protein
MSLDRDIFGDYYAEETGSRTRQCSGYFPTPMSVASIMTDATMRGCALTETVCDPCVGSGRLLLPASNFSLFLSGTDINPVCIRMTLVNGFLFAPQIVITPPEEIKRGKAVQFDRNIKNILPRRNSHDEGRSTAQGERQTSVDRKHLPATRT